MGLNFNNPPGFGGQHSAITADTWKRLRCTGRNLNRRGSGCIRRTQIAILTIVDFFNLLVPFTQVLKIHRFDVIDVHLGSTRERKFFRINRFRIRFLQGLLDRWIFGKRLIETAVDFDPRRTIGDRCG